MSDSTFCGGKRRHNLLSYWLWAHKPVVITKSPDKPNLVYSVHEKSEMEEVFDWSIEECELNFCKWKKGHHFCRTYDSCSELFSSFQRKLSKEITGPIGHFAFQASEQVVSSYCNSCFWDGYRLSNVRRVIHWGPPSDLEMYIQETGWAG